MKSLLFAATMLVCLPAMGSGGQRSNGGFYGASIGAVSSSSPLRLDADVALQFGTAGNPEYWWIYDSANTQYELNGTDCDGGGTDCVILEVEDGTGSVFLNDHLRLTSGKSIYYDWSTGGPFYSTLTVTAGAYVWVSNGTTFLQANSTGPILPTNRQFRLGTTSQYQFGYIAANTQFNLSSTDCDGGGTDCDVLKIKDGEDKLYLVNDEFISNNTDGKLTLGASGGTNNEDIVLDFESNANTLLISSNTGLTTINASSLTAIKLYFDSFLAPSGSGAAGYHFNNASELRSYTDGQLQIENDAQSFGITIDVDDAADTAVLKDRAGTGAGSLIVTGNTDLDGALRVAHIVIDCTNDGYAVPATAQYVTIETGTGACTGNMDVSLPAVACTPAAAQDSCRRVHITRIGAVQVDIDADAAETINGSATYSLTADYQTATLVETNSASTDWIVE